MCELGAIVNIIGNWILILQYSYIGAAIASVFSEITLLVYLVMSRKYYKISNYALDLGKICIGNVIMGTLVFGVNQMNINVILKLII